MVGLDSDTKRLLNSIIVNDVKTKNIKNILNISSTELKLTLSEENYPKVNRLTSDIDNIPYKELMNPINKKFDMMVSVNDLNYCHYPEQVLSYLYNNHLKLEGFFIALVHNADNIDYKLDGMHTHFLYDPSFKNKNNKNQPLRYLNQQMVVKLFENTNYKIHNVVGCNWGSSNYFSSFINSFKNSYSNIEDLETFKIYDCLRKSFSKNAPSILVVAQKIREY